MDMKRVIRIANYVAEINGDSIPEIPNTQTIEFISGLNKYRFSFDGDKVSVHKSTNGAEHRITVQLETSNSLTIS